MRATMTLPSETEAGSAGMHPCRGITWWAHRDDIAGRGSSSSALFPKTHRIGRLLCLENPRPEGVEYSLTEGAPAPFHAEPEHTHSSRWVSQWPAKTCTTRLRIEAPSSNRKRHRFPKPGLRISFTFMLTPCRPDRFPGREKVASAVVDKKRGFRKLDRAGPRHPVWSGNWIYVKLRWFRRCPHAR